MTSHSLTTAFPVQTSFAVGIPVPAIPEHDPSGAASTPTCPDISLPWSADSALAGWSARMYLHQLLSTSTQRWQPSDTEQLLSGWTPQKLRGNPGSATSLSDAIKTPGSACDNSFRTAKMVRGLVRRALARGRSLRVLLRTAHDTIPVIVTFTNTHDSASWTAKSARPLLASLVDGLLDTLRQHAPECAETPSCPK